MYYIPILLNSDNSLVWGTDQNMRVSRWIFRWTIYLKSSLSLLLAVSIVATLRFWVANTDLPAAATAPTEKIQTMCLLCVMIIFGSTLLSKAERKNSSFKKQGPDFVTTGLVLIWQSLSDSDMSDTHSSSHLPFLGYLRSKQASSHCDFSNVTLCPQRPFCIRRKSFFFPSALLSLCNLLSCSFSQHAENRLGLKGLLFNWKHLGGRELDWWAYTPPPDAIRADE